LLSACLVSSGVWGQVAESPEASPPGKTATVPLKRAPLDAVVLVDEDTGKEVLTLPGRWPLEEIDEFHSFVIRNEREVIPPFTIQQITAQGQVVDDRVETELHLVITTTGNQTIRIPLGLKEGILPFSSTDDVSGQVGVELPLPYHYAGPGTFDLIVDPQDGQYIGLIRNQDHVEKESPSVSEGLPEQSASSEAEPEKTSPEVEPEKRRPKEVTTEQRHELTLKLWFPLTGHGEEDRRLTISFPKALGSQFRLSVPMPGATATISPGTLLDTFFPEDGRTTLFTARGLRSNFDISWHRGKADQPVERPVLNLQDAAIVARLESQATLYDVVFPISSPVAFDRVFLRFPQGTALVQEGSESVELGNEYKLHKLSVEEKSTIPTGSEVVLDSDSTVYEVRFSRKAGTQIVRFRAVQAIPADKAGEFRNIGGFEVLGAEQQTGTLSIGIPAEMRPNWKPVRGLRRVDLPVSSVQEGIDARFEFFLQPFLLRAQIVLPQTRINVKPEYQIRVRKGQLFLTAKFSYVVLGSKTDKLQLTFPDWLLIDIGPSDIIDDKGVRKDENDHLLTLPLQAPSDGSFEIDLTAFQTISLDEKKQRLIVRLPELVADWIEPASVVIVSDDNVELLPVDAETAAISEEPDSDFPRQTIGLARKGRRTLPIRIDIPPRQQDPLVYQTESATSIFVADLLYHRQTVSVSVQSNVQLFEPENQVSTNLIYSVAYEPVDRLVLLVPKSVDETGRWSVSLGDQILETRDMPIAAEQDHWMKKRISLPEAMIGKIPLTVGYSIPPVSVDRNHSGAVCSIPLVHPAEANVSGFSVYLSVPGGLRVEPHGDNDGVWTQTDVSFPDNFVSRRQLRTVGFSSAQLQDEIRLLISLGERETQGTTVVEKAWIQTWLTDRVRMDRLVCQLTSDRESITLTLPPSLGKGIRILLDNTPVLARSTIEGDLVIPLTPEQQFRPLVLDVLYQLPETPPHGFVQMELPQFDPNTVVRFAYWQLIFPQNRHLVGLPTGWAPEYDWHWNGLFWGRVPSLRMESIGFSGTPAQQPPTDASQYLFSSFHPTAKVSFYVLNRSWIVLVSSGLSLLVGLALIYLPRCRYAGSLLGLGIALLATVLYQPAPVLLALQAASCGVFLALGASYVYRMLNRGDHRQAVPQRPLRQIPDEESQFAEVYPVIVDESGSKKEESAAKNRELHT